MIGPAPIRVAVLFADLDVDRTQRCALQLVEELDRRWFAPEVWALRGGHGSTAALRATGTPVVLLSQGRAAGPVTIARLAMRLWRERPSLLYAPTASPGTWARSLAAILRIPVATMPDGEVRVDTAYRLREIAQRNSSWTMTESGEIPPESSLWPGPGVAAPPERIIERGRLRPNRSLRRVTAATLTAFLPPPQRATGAAVVICPGGGYEGVTIDREGYDVARWLSTRGIAGLVLKYRLPQVAATGDETPWPLQDIVRALALTRERAQEWQVDPRRIGVMGFSAGGHMAAYASTVDPDLAFAVLVYPVISLAPDLTHRGSRERLLGARPSDATTARYSAEQRVTATTTPTFLVHARDDDVVKVVNSELHAGALRRAGVPHECLLYERGGHGFGLAADGGEPAAWPDRCMTWLRARGVLPAAQGLGRM